jgi:hypothetical protein
VTFGGDSPLPIQAARKLEIHQGDKDQKRVAHEIQRAKQEGDALSQAVTAPRQLTTIGHAPNSLWTENQPLGLMPSTNIGLGRIVQHREHRRIGVWNQ